MTRCLRIFGAYSYRLTRRHSTVLLIVSFIISLIIILHLYVYRNNKHSHTQVRIGDFDYQPGAFLAGHHPYQNKTFCEFHYGLPETFKLSKVPTVGTPENKDISPFRVIYNVVTGTAYANATKFNAVTYVTQATPEFMYHIVEIAKHWDGPISLSVFVPDYDLDLTVQIMNHMCHCYEGMSKVSLHLFFPKRHPPKLGSKEQLRTTTEISTTSLTIAQIFKKKAENYRNLNNQSRSEFIRRARESKALKMMSKVQFKRTNAPLLKFPDCRGPANSNIPTYRKEQNLIYPINVGRNVARNASKTNYFLVSDIELVPSEGLAPKFLTMVKKLMGDKKREEGCIFSKTVFVVPLFEVERGEEIPRDKDTLIHMVADNRAMYFHQRICPHCQRFPGMQTWLSKPSPKGVEPMVIGKREYPYHRWEPLYFGTQKEPWYSEMLSWEGKQDKMTQMLELCLQEYRMVVIDGGFLCHAAPVGKSPHHQRAERINARKYLKIIKDLKSRYKEHPRCKVS